MALTQVSTDGVKDANINTADIADQAVALSKLPHGDGSSDGKFLRANNGADPTFESLPTSGISDVVSDTSPQLGGDLDSNTKNIKLGDSASHGASGDDTLIFGADDDMRIYHDGSNAFISNNTGAFVIQDSHAGANAVVIRKGAEVELLHNNVLACETSANGLAFPSGKGIDFSASSNESGSTTELLDDYEEGTFTPTWTFGPNEASGVSYATNTGTYRKIGKFVFFSIHIQLSNKGTISGAGYAQIAGLPFAVDSSGGFGSIAYYDNFGSYNPSVARVTPSEQIYIAQHNSGGYSQDLQHSFMNNSTRLYVGGSYPTTS